MDPTDLQRLNEQLDQQNDIRDKIKDIVTEFDKKTRVMTGILNKIHATPSTQYQQLLNTVKPTLLSCSEVAQGMAEVIPPDEFWKWKEMWSTSLRSAVFSAALIEFLESSELLSLSKTAAKLGIKPEWEDRFTLKAEDYLLGLINLVNELSRLAVNSVTMGDYEMPVRISVFVKDLFAGFSVLNLKNDQLRRRYDSLKYDVKKVEEVVYDLSLRKLTGVHTEKAI